jgi:hypothetical protein
MILILKLVILMLGLLFFEFILAFFLGIALLQYLIVHPLEVELYQFISLILLVLDIPWSELEILNPEFLITH